MGVMTRATIYVHLIYAGLPTKCLVFPVSNLYNSCTELEMCGRRLRDVK